MFWILWPIGKNLAHDFRIFCYSKVSSMFERGHSGNGILLAESGYAVTKYYITPILIVQSPTENFFNES